MVGGEGSCYDFLGQCEVGSVFRTSIMVLEVGKVSATDGRFWYQPGKLVRKQRERQTGLG